MTHDLTTAAAAMPSDRRRRLAWALAEQRDNLAADGDHGLAGIFQAVVLALVEANAAERDALRKLDFTPGVTAEPAQLLADDDSAV